MTREHELEKLIKKYATEYYAGTPVVSDEYFDNLVEEMKSINPDSPVLKTAWGYDPKEKHPHWYDLHVGSLPKIKEGHLNRYDYTESTRVSAKLDGLSIVSYYINGSLVQSITRGNGYEGLDVTHKVRMIAPEVMTLKDIDGSPFTGAIRGEVVMPMTTWYNKYAGQRDENSSLNPRNLTSGLMNRLVLEPADAEGLDYVLYKVLHSENCEYKSIQEVDEFFLRCNSNLKYVDYVYGSDFKDGTLADIFNEFSKKYPCDGLVMTDYEDGEYKEIAYKFLADCERVTVTKVTYTATRTGRMAPRVWFEPIELSGAMVQKATGHNAAFIKDNRIGPGAVISVCRSGEVIPYIVDVVTPSEEELSSYLPSNCPNCDSGLIWSGEDLVCVYENDAQLGYHFITTCASIDGAGWGLYSKIVEGLNLFTEEDLVTFLTRLKNEGIDFAIEELNQNSDISGSVTWRKVEEILRKLSAPINPVRLLCACSIKGISWNTADSILKDYPEFIEDSHDKFDQTKLQSIKGIGYRTVTSLNNFRERISDLAKSITLEEYVPQEEVVAQFKVAITGKLSMKRDDFVKLLNDKGIEVSGINKETKYLITDNPNSGSSKNKLADKFGVTKITEEEFTSKYLKE